MNLNIRAMGIELTPAIRSYVEEKMFALEKYSPVIVHLEVDLGRVTQHHQKGEVFTCSALVHLPGDVIKIEKTEEYLYKSIDKVKDHLREILVNEKERVRDGHRGE